MAFSYDLNTNVGKVRLLIRDTDQTKALFQDEELQFFLDQNSANLLLAAADALESLASNAALLHKLEEIGDYRFDSKGMSAALLKMAARYREKVEQEPAFAVAEQTLSVFNEAEILWNEALKTAGGS